MNQDDDIEEDGIDDYFRCLHTHGAGASRWRWLRGSQRTSLNSIGRHFGHGSRSRVPGESKPNETLMITNGRTKELSFFCHPFSCLLGLGKYGKGASWQCRCPEQPSSVCKAQFAFDLISGPTFITQTAEGTGLVSFGEAAALIIDISCLALCGWTNHRTLI